MLFASCMSLNIQTYLSQQKKRHTRISLRGVAAKMTIEIESAGSINEDKEFVKSFVRHIRPWLKYFNRSEITHHDLNRACGIESPHARAGFEIRIQRLKLGLTQKKLADLSNLSQRHVSLIERAKIWPREQTLKQIKQALAACDLQMQPMLPLHPHPSRSQSVYTV